MMTTTTPAVTMNDYERRFQRSVQKLIIPSWCTDITSSSKISNTSKQSLISSTSVPWKADYKEPERTPEIIHIRRPRSYRSCRSSLATSPSPSIHSWHPNHIIDGVNFSLLIPSSSSSSSRRHIKYEKGIERVSKSSRWYQPTQLSANKPTNDQTGIIKIFPSSKHKQQQSNENNHYDTPKIYNINERLIENSNHSIVNSNTENIIDVITINKQQDNHIKSNESQPMPLANTTSEPFSHIELIEVTDEDDDNNQSNKVIEDNNELLERTASELVESVLAEILLLKNLNDFINDDNDDDKNVGVRELSEDENGLRELDENDMNDTDEFIVLATKADTSDDEQTSDIPRCNLNRLYTFSKITDNAIDNLKQTNSNQNSPRLILEKDVITTEPFEEIFHSNNEKQYIHEIICPSNSQSSSEGVNEETARIGRLLLDSIQPPTIPRSKLKNTKFNHDNHYESPREDYRRNQQCIIEEYDEDIHDKTRRDSAYSSNQERINIHHSIYEPLSECYSGYSFVQSDFLTTNISSLQSTTDEAYESEPTTISSSIATTTTAHVHPDLEHEFEYPSPPPPVPDRRLKPIHLKTIPPPTKPRLTKQNTFDSNGYSIVQKTKPLSSTAAIQQLITSIANQSNSNSTRSMSSRHYCGSIPISNQAAQSSENSTSTKTKDKNKEKRNSRTLNCLHPSTTDDKQRNRISSSNKIKKQKLITDFDEATNGLAIFLPDRQDSIHKQNFTKTSTPSSIKRTNGMTKDRTKSNRPSFYETSV